MKLSMSIKTHIAQLPLVSFQRSGLNMDTNFSPWERKQKGVAVTGATGTGKSRLAIDCATRFDAEIVNTDEMNRATVFQEETQVAAEVVKMAAEPGLSMRNRYWIVRHGKSIPNEIGRIVCSMENGTLAKYELASEGVHQARLAGELFLKELMENNIPLQNVRICYSPFSRTTHTAKVIASVLDLPFDGPQCKMIEDLRERYFGPSFELMSHEKYPEVWALDENDPFLPPVGGESVANVVTRLTSAISLIESEFQGCAILVVSHGDPLQILQTIVNAAKKEASGRNDFRSRVESVQSAGVLTAHLKFGLGTGELRRLM